MKEPWKISIEQDSGETGSNAFYPVDLEEGESMLFERRPGSAHLKIT